MPTLYEIGPFVTEVPEGIDLLKFGGACARCEITHEVLYVRSAGQRLCIHCVDLEATGKKHTGQGGGRRGADEERPYNQPTPVKLHSGKRELCPWCARMASPVFDFYGYTFNSCGWGCAGLWMDWVAVQLHGPIQEARELAEGEEYVLRSLGVIDAATVHEDQAEPEPAVPDGERAGPAG